MPEPRESRFTLTRTEVAARLGISVASVRRLEYERLFPSQDARGVHRFDPVEVDAMAVATRRRSPPAPVADEDARRRCIEKRGRIAARVFRMFGRGMNLAQIVVATNVAPDVVRDLYREWSTSLEHGEWERRALDAERI